MYSIGILTSCESERHLSMPIFRELYNIDCNPHMIQIEQNDIPASYSTVHDLIHEFEFDFILAVGDRPEQIGGVLAAFHNKIPIGHLFAGDHNTISSGVTTFDDVHRHSISLYADIQFCSCEESKINVKFLMSSIGLTPNAHNVGATHFNGIDVEKVRDICKTKRNYILILINSETTGNDIKLIEDTILHALEYKNTHDFIILNGNGDSTTISMTLRTELINTRTKYKYSVYMCGNQDHEHFLSLLMNCSKFITNSSCVSYEAPFLMDESNIIKIGNRNKNRTLIPLKSHSGNASKKTAILIKEYLQNR